MTTPPPTSWPYVSLTLNVRWFPDEPAWRVPVLLISTHVEAKGGTGCAPPGQSETTEPYYRLSALVYAKLEAAVRKLSTRRDEITGGPHPAVPAALAEAAERMRPLREFLTDRYREAAIAEGFTADDATVALEDDLRAGAHTSATLPRLPQLPRIPQSWVDGTDRGHGKGGSGWIVDRWVEAAETADAPD